MSRATSSRPFAIALGAALALHTVLLWPELRRPGMDFDGLHVYLPYARALLDEGLTFFATERSAHVSPVAYLYPALVGASLDAVKAANFALSFVTLLLVARTTWLLHSRLAAVLAALLFAASPLLRPWLTPALTEAPYVFLAAAWVWSFAEWLDRRRPVHVVLGAVALGLAILTRGSILYLVPLLAGIFGWIAWRSQGTARAAAAGALALHLLALVPPGLVIVKNALLFGYPAIATGAGNALYLGNHPVTGGYDGPYLGIGYDTGAVARDASHLAIASDRLLAAAGRLEIADQGAGQLARAYARKLLAFVFVSNAEMTDRVVVLRSWRIAMLVLAVYGLWRLRRTWLAWTLAGIVAYQVAVHLPALYTHRYSVGAMDPWLVILGSAGVATLAAERNRRHALAMVGVLAAGILGGVAAHRYGGLPEPDLFRSARLLIWEGQPRRVLLESGHPVEIEVNDAPGFHPWADHILVLELAVEGSDRRCEWVRISYRRKADAAFAPGHSRCVAGAGARYQLGGIPLHLNAEGVLRFEAAQGRRVTMDVKRMAIYSPRGALDYRARVLGQPIDPKYER